MQKVYVYKNNTGEYVGEWGTIKECSNSLEIERTAVSRCLSGEYKSTGGYMFSDHRIYNEVNKDRTTLDMFTHSFLEQLSLQEMEMLIRNDNKTDLRYKKHLQNMEQKILFYYENIDKSKEALEKIKELQYDFYTWYDFEELILHIDNSDMNMYKNEKLLLDYDLDKIF